MTKTSNPGLDLPVRMAYLTDGSRVIAGTPGSFDDAGWDIVHCSSSSDRANVAAAFPHARMPSWAGLGL